MHTYTPANSTFNGRRTNLLSILCTVIEVFSRGLANGEKSLNDFKFGTFIGRFPNAGGANMAVKGLSKERQLRDSLLRI